MAWELLASFAKFIVKIEGKDKVENFEKIKFGSKRNFYSKFGVKGDVATQITNIIQKKSISLYKDKKIEDMIVNHTCNLNKRCSGAWFSRVLNLSE